MSDTKLNLQASIKNDALNDIFIPTSPKSAGSPKRVNQFNDYSKLNKEYIYTRFS